MLTEENKFLAKYMHSAFGGNPNARVINYWNNDESLSIPILICPESPREGLTTYATVGLSDYPMYQDNEEFHVRLEIIGACCSEIKWFPNILATSAFYVIQNGWLYRPGSTIENVVNIYDSNTEMKYIYFTSPFLWQELETLQCKPKKVVWLLSVLISEAECNYLKRYGSDKFEDLLEECNVDVFDIARFSVLF